MQQVRSLRSRLGRNQPDYALALGFDAEVAEPSGAADGPSLDQLVARMKARWLRRVIYGSAANSSQKCLAYAVFDHLNCVTLDCWPSQERLAKLLGFGSVKTVQRAANGLEVLRLLTISGGGRIGYRYAPIFLPEDEDNPVPSSGRIRPVSTDKTVSESFLRIRSNRPASTAAEEERLRDVGFDYQPLQRGAIELQVAERLGANGMEVLAKLSARDDRIVERLCRAHAAGQLRDRELNAARLAAAQVRL